MPDINARNSGKQGDTPLMLLLKKPQLREDDEIPKIEVLLGLGASWTATNNVSLNADAIARIHDPTIISRLKNTKPIDTDNRLTISESPDSYAVAPAMQKMFSGINGDTYSSFLFEEAVMQAPNIDGRNSGKKGDTALMMLLRKETLDPQRDFPKIRILLKHGASWTATNNKGETALHLAEKYPREVQEELESLRNSIDSSQSVYSENKSSMAMKNDSTPVRSGINQRIASRNLNIHSIISDNAQPRQLNLKEIQIIDAIKTKKLTIEEFERLIRRIDNLNFRNESDIGDTPLMMMLRYQELSANDIMKCRILLCYGASWNYPNKYGESAESLTAGVKKPFYLK